MAGSRGAPSGDSGRPTRATTRGVGRVAAPGTVRNRALTIGQVGATGTPRPVRNCAFSYAQMAATAAPQESSTNNNNNSNLGTNAQQPNAQQPNASAATLVPTLNPPKPSLDLRWRGVSNKKRIEKWDDCRAGQIVYAAVHTTDIESETAARNRDSLRTRDGDWVFSKRRPLVVLWRYDEVFFALPVYSHQNTGIPVERKHEYISLGHIGSSNAEIIQQGLEKYPMLTAVTENFRFREGSSVHLPGGVKVKYGSKARVIGAIGTNDWRRLVNTWQMLAGVSITDFRDYVDRVDRGERFNGFDHVNGGPPPPPPDPPGGPPR